MRKGRQLVRSLAAGLACAFTGACGGGGGDAPSPLGTPLITQVTGTISDKSSVTITGTDFATKAQAAPVLWDAVDNQAAYAGLSDGNIIPVGGGNPWGAQCVLSGGTCVKYESSDPQRSTGTAFYKTTSDAHAYMENVTWTKTNYVYVSWWWRATSQVHDGGNHSSKFLRLSDSTAEANRTLSWTQLEINVFNFATNLVGFYNTSNRVNEWDFFELWVDSVNHTVTGRVNGAAIFTGYNWGNAAPMQFNEVWKIGLDSGGANPLSISASLDDIYVDSTFSRVMIGDAPTYVGSTHFEMQIPTTWSNTSIHATLNRGSFAPGSTVYVYVANAAGNVNPNGFPITF